MSHRLLIRKSFSQAIILLLALLMSPQADWATCGGGAQTGQKEKALALLKRHFFEYERYQAVRSKEMMEARLDAVFASMRADPAFVTLTSGADGRLPLPKGMPADSGSGGMN
ncbi:MAG TPA: hypothetical protein VKV95_02810 [Terriglobia bacterium]|nr:hypothetical protein [Terriglobia bacterium]